MTYVDPDGNEITLEQWVELSDGDQVGTVLADSVVPTPGGDVRVITKWLGTAMPEIDVLPFGTARAPVGARVWVELEQYDSKADALAGHARWCSALHNG